MQDKIIPLGLCQCGCGERTSISPQSHTDRGYVRGEPRRFRPGHYARSHPSWVPGSGWAEEDRGYETPCWIWQRAKNPWGYGYRCHGGVMRLAHRVFYEERYGPVPGGLELDHLCRVKPCVRPEHLEAVTHVENMRRGRRTKLTLASATQIKIMKLSTSLSQAEIADILGVRHSVVSQVLHGRTWRT